MKNVLIIDPGYLREQTFRPLFLGGYKVTVLSTLESAHAGYVSHQIFVPSLEDHDTVFHHLNAFHKREHTIDGMLTYNDSQLELLSVMATRLGLPCVSPEKMRLLRSKFWCAQRLLSKGVKTATSFLVTSAENLANLPAGGLSYPCIIKPDRGSCSLGVQKACSPEEVDTAVSSARDFFSHEVLIQSYLKGPEYCVEAYISRGEVVVLGISEKIYTHGYIDMGTVFPASLSKTQEKAIRSLVRRALEALEVEHMVTHTEVILTSEGPAVVEVNFRPAGDLIPLHFERTLGLSLDLLAATVASGGTPPKVSGQPQGVSAVRFFIHQEWVRAKELLYPLLEPGDKVFVLNRNQGKLRCNADRMFCLAMRASSREKIEEKLNRLDENFK